MCWGYEARKVRGHVCVLGYQARKVRGHVYVLGVSSQESERSCMCVGGIKPGK